jgi:hypothetical protein
MPLVLFADTKAMKMKVRPVKADLQDGVKIGQGAIGSYEKAPPEHRMNPAAQSAIRLLAHVLSGDARQLAGQLTGRLFGNKTPSILSCSRNFDKPRA